MSKESVVVSDQSGVRGQTVPRAHGRRIGWEKIAAIAIILPSLLAVGLFVYGFMSWTAFVSMTAWRGARPDFTFVGLRNYARLFVVPGIDQLRWTIDIRNAVGFTLLFVLACIIIGFMLAALLDRHIRGESVFRSIFIFPMAISFIVTGVAWRWLLSPGTPETGTTGVNLLFEYIGMPFLKSNWFADPAVYHIPPDSGVGQLLTGIGLGALASPNVGISLGVISLVIAASWQLSGYCMALYLAGMRSIPEELREAARIDGASEWQVYRHIVIPMLNPVTFTAIIILGHISLKIYDLVVAMTGPGPGFATDMPAFNMWETVFDGGRFGVGASMGIVILLLVAFLIIPYLIWNRREEAKV